jgi:hypothetical protein
LSAKSYLRKTILQLIPNAPETMTSQSKIQPSRRLACPRCGTEFTCGLAGPCWCSDESFRLPMPLDGEDCLCRDCLRKAAEQKPGAPRPR